MNPNPSKHCTTQAIAEALRGFELKRAGRTHDMVKLARYNVNVVCRPRTWLVLYSC
jgi:hypothetical protein